MTDARLRKSAWRVDAGAPLTDIGQSAPLHSYSSYLSATAVSFASNGAATFLRGNILTMDAQAARRPVFLTTCARCGGKLFEPVNFCPHCGAPAKPASSESASAKKPDAATASRTASATAARPEVAPDRSQPVRPTRFARADPYGDTRSPPVSRDGSRSWRVKVGAAALAALVVLCGAVVLLNRHDGSSDGEQAAASNTVQGSVTANGSSQARQEPAANAPAIAPGTAQNPVVGQSSTSTVGATAASDAVSAPPPPSTATPQPSQSASSQRQGDKNQRLMALALARAHAGLEKNDLRMARSGVFWALSLQHDNSEALMLKQELLSRERARSTP